MATDVIVGKNIGNYYIEEIIASDHTGSIYKGKHSVFTGRPPVAIKVLAKHISARIDNAQFMSETQALIQLKHQNIRSLIEAGKDGANFYLISQYEPLASLQERLQDQGQTPMPVEEALLLLDQIAKALRFAHEAGIIHRNLKPSTILFLTPNHIVVTDFGLAVTSNMTQTPPTTEQKLQTDAQAYLPADSQTTTLIKENDTDTEWSRTDREIDLYESLLLDFDTTNTTAVETVPTTTITPTIPEQQNVAEVEGREKEETWTETSIDPEDLALNELETSTSTEQENIIHPEVYAYLAPEQFNGKARKKSDQYALACIAYELFTGHKPFDAPIDADRTAWLQIHQQEKPTPPSYYNSTLPDYIELALLKALQEEYRARYKDINSFIQALHNIVAIEAAPPKRERKFIQFAKNWLHRDERAHYVDGEYQIIPWGQRIVAALCYLTIGIGGIILLFSRRRQQRFVRYHAWQAALYTLTLCIMWVISRILVARPGIVANLVMVFGDMLVCVLVVYIVLSIEKTLKGLYYKTPLLGWIAGFLTQIYR